MEIGPHVFEKSENRRTHTSQPLDGISIGGSAEVWYAHPKMVDHAGANNPIVKQPGIKLTTIESPVKSNAPTTKLSSNLSKVTERPCCFTINTIYLCVTPQHVGTCRVFNSVHTAYFARPSDADDMDPTDVSDATAEIKVREDDGVASFNAC